MVGNLEKRDHWEDLGVGREMMSKWMVNTIGGCRLE
jgi:hypothetical protein